MYENKQTFGHETNIYKTYFQDVNFHERRHMTAPVHYIFVLYSLSNFSGFQIQKFRELYQMIYRLTIESNLESMPKSCLREVNIVKSFKLTSSFCPSSVKCTKNWKLDKSKWSLIISSYFQILVTTDIQMKRLRSNQFRKKLLCCHKQHVNSFKMQISFQKSTLALASASFFFSSWAFFLSARPSCLNFFEKQF